MRQHRRFRSTQVGTDSSALVQLSGDHCVPSIVNQTIDAVTVCATIDGADIKVEFMADNGWLIKDARLWIGLDLADIPQDANHDPILAEMPLQSGWLDPLVSTYESRVPLSQFGGSPDDYICDPKRIYIVPKAAMLDASCTFGIAWGGGTLMGTWSRYVDVQSLRATASRLRPPLRDGIRPRRPRLDLFHRHPRDQREPLGVDPRSVGCRKLRRADAADLRSLTSRSAALDAIPPRTWPTSPTIPGFAS